MNQRIAYSYDSDSGEYLGECRCQPDPLDGGYLLPAHATSDEPPKTQTWEVAIWKGNRWEAATDARQLIWWHKVTREPYRPQLPEEIINADFYVAVPPPGVSMWERWDDAEGKWINDPPPPPVDVLAIAEQAKDFDDFKARLRAARVAL